MQTFESLKTFVHVKFLILTLKYLDLSFLNLGVSLKVIMFLFFSEQSLCHRMKAESLKLSELGDEESHIYECEPDGTFR